MTKSPRTARWRRLILQRRPGRTNTAGTDGSGTVGSLRSKGLDGPQAGSLPRWIVAEENADGAGEQKGRQNGRDGNGVAPLEPVAEDIRTKAPPGVPDQPPRQGHDHRFH